MTDKNEAMEAFLQDFEGRHDGSLVTGFLVVAELAIPTHPDSSGWSYFSKGSAAMLLGLAEQARWVVRRDIQGRSEG
jgi:hypothetical protein